MEEMFNVHIDLNVKKSQHVKQIFPTSVNWDKSVYLKFWAVTKKKQLKISRNTAMHPWPHPSSFIKTETCSWLELQGGLCTEFLLYIKLQNLSEHMEGKNVMSSWKLYLGKWLTLWWGRRDLKDWGLGWDPVHIRLKSWFKLPTWKQMV